MILVIRGRIGYASLGSVGGREPAGARRRFLMSRSIKSLVASAWPLLAIIAIAIDLGRRW